MAQDYENEIQKLLNKMTVKEKIGQLNMLRYTPMKDSLCDTKEKELKDGLVGSYIGVSKSEVANHLQKIAVEESPNGIPLLFGLDVIHGRHTIFPIPLAEACCWDDEIFEKTAETAAEEAAEDGVNWTFAPMLDVVRDARWGRVAESAGEDPYLLSRYSKAKVKGFQGEDVSEKNRVLACAKHFVGYGAAIGGRDYNGVTMGPQTLWDVYMPPFAAAVEAGVTTFMTAFQEINGTPCSANSYLFRNVLREKWGYKGLVVSDDGAVQECVQHGVAADHKEAAALCLNAGVDIDMEDEVYSRHVEELINEGKISMEVLDEAVGNVLRMKFEKGLFDNPYVEIKTRADDDISEEKRKFAREVAQKSIVLLKNENILPLTGREKIAVVGELADSGLDMLGTWVLKEKPHTVVTLLRGLRNRGIEVQYASCCDTKSKFDRAVFEKTIQGADVVIAAVGETALMSGEASSRCDIDLPGRQKEMIAALHESGKPFITTLFNGRPLAIKEVVEMSPAVVEAWALGIEAGNAIADVLFGDYNPSGRLTMTFPNYSGECPVYYNHNNTGRPASEIYDLSSKYLDAPIHPLYPFGYGLSYTEYKYEDLVLEINGDVITASFTVRNIGDMDGEETVQLYVHDVVGSCARPVRELKNYTKVYLRAGESKQISLDVHFSQLGFYNLEMEYVVEPGEFEIFVGHDSTAELCGSVVLR